jgi:hypothetical protein
MVILIDAVKDSSEFSKLIDEQWDVYAKVIKKANVKAD